MKSFFCTLFYIFTFHFACAQGWERLYPLNLDNNINFTLAPMPDGGFLVIEDNGADVNPTNVLVRLSSNGSVQGVQNQQDVLGMIRPAVLPVGNGELLF